MQNTWLFFAYYNKKYYYCNYYLNLFVKNMNISKKMFFKITPINY